MQRLLRQLLIAPIAFVALTGCRGDSTAPVLVENTIFAEALGVDLSAMTRTGTGLYYQDLETGDGAIAQTGQRVTVHYNAWLSDGRKIDSSIDRNTPFSFDLGARSVILGWEQGVPGMRVGGRRRLIVPPSLGYGAQPYGGIPGNSVLVFDIELLGVQ